MLVLWIRPGQAPEPLELDGTLEGMQKQVGGYIQAVYPWEDPVALICNEDGKALQLPLNRALMNPENGEIYDIIAGDFFICGLGEEDFDSLSPELMEKYRRLFEKRETFIRRDGGIVMLQG